MIAGQRVKRVVMMITTSISLLFLISGCTEDKKQKKIQPQTAIRLAFWGEVRNQALAKALADAFQKSHPSFQIRLVFLYGDELLTMIAGGDAPDLMLLLPAEMQNFASRGVLLNLQPYMDGDKEFQSFKEDIYPATLEASKYRGINYSVPFWTNSVVLFYNKDLFDKEGIKYPDGNWDLNKLVSAGKILTKDIDNDGKIDQYAFFTSHSFLDTFGGLYQYMRKNGGRLFNKDMNKCLITNPENIDAIRWCFDLFTKYKISPSPSSGDERLRDYEQAFLSGKVAMTISGRWSITRFSKTKFNWSCAPQPKGKVEFKPTEPVLFGAYKKTKYSEECWEFLKFVMGNEAQTIACNLKADIPIRISVANSPAFLNWLSRPEENRIFLQELENSETFPHFPKEREWLSSGDQKLQLVLLGQKDLEVACKEIAEEYEKFRKE